MCINFNFSPSVGNFNVDFLTSGFSLHMLSFMNIDHMLLAMASKILTLLTTNL